MEQIDEVNIKLNNYVDHQTFEELIRRVKLKVSFDDMAPYNRRLNEID